MDARVASLGSEERDLGPDSPEGVRIASIRSLAAEAGLTLGPVTEANIEQAPELAVVEALTGTAASQNEATTILESAKVNENGNRIRTALSSASQGVGPESGSSPIQRQAVRPNAEPNSFVKEGIRGYNSKYD